MILLTGGSGFIGSVILSYFNRFGIRDVLIVDSFEDNCGSKWKNLLGKNFLDLCDKKVFLENLSSINNIDFIIHLGACTDTSIYDVGFFLENNFNFSKILCCYAIDKKIPFIYASSAATYGAGCLGFNDSIESIHKLKPLNPYGFSKHIFDLWLINQYMKPIKWAALKFFNVYGPNEYHKGQMASMVYQIYNQLKLNGSIKLFKSNSEDITDGEQKRDFVYVEDIAKIIYNMFVGKFKNDIYNVGVGKSESFNELAHLIMHFSGINGKIIYVDIPDSFKENFQNYTKANNMKLIDNKLIDKFTNLEEGVEIYIKNYLQNRVKYY